MNKISIGVCAYNEEKNIGKLLKVLLSQKLENNKIKEIIVVSSGSTDRTNEIVKKFMKKDKRIKLIEQKERRGKASAVNLVIKNVTGNIIVLESADTLPGKNTVDELVRPFYDRKVGMTGGRPDPVDDRKIFMGWATHFLWGAHHFASLIKPKLGEMVAFRNIVKKIPEDTAVDEACLQAIFEQREYKVVYVPSAIVYNKGPETISDFIKQRRRIYIGHTHLKKTKGYQISTMSTFGIIYSIIGYFTLNPIKISWAIAIIFLELISRMLATIDFYILKKNPYIWDIPETTKELDIK